MCECERASWQSDECHPSDLKSTFLALSVEPSHTYTHTETKYIHTQTHTQYNVFTCKHNTRTYTHNTKYTPESTINVHTEQNTHTMKMHTHSIRVHTKSKINRHKHNTKCTRPHTYYTLTHRYTLHTQCTQFTHKPTHHFTSNIMGCVSSFLIKACNQSACSRSLRRPISLNNSKRTKQHQAPGMSQAPTKTNNLVCASK